MRACVPRLLQSWLACLLPLAAGAQVFAFTPNVQAGWRADAMFGVPHGAELGAAINVPAGYYVRLGLDAGAGVAAGDARAALAGRVDLTARYLLDPFSEFRWGPYAGGGLTSRWADTAGWRASLLVFLGLEGPASHGWRTAVEMGAGGGLRFGIVFRRARRNGR